MSSTERKVGNHTVKIVMPDSDNVITPDDKDMDMRVTAAVNSAIHKAKVCQKPIAKYDQRKKKAYVEHSDGVKEYVS